MKKLLLSLLVCMSISFVGCNGCNGPADCPPVDPNDTTVVDTTHDTITNPDTVVIIK